MVYNIYYSIDSNKIKSFDIHKEGKIVAMKAIASIIITTFFYIIVKMANRLKYWMNGLSGVMKNF